MQTKRGFRAEIKDADRGTFVAMFATFNVKDHDSDVTLPGAFEDGAKMPVSAYNHSSWSGALPVGKAVIRTTAKEAQAHGRFFMDTQAGLDTFRTVKALHEDGMGEWSYGYDSVQVSFGEWPTAGDGPKEQVRFLEQQRVHEVSPVLLGAGIGTQTLDAKGVFDDDEIERMIRSLPPDCRKAAMGLLESLIRNDSSRDDGREAVLREALRFEVGRNQRFSYGGRP